MDDDHLSDLSELLHKRAVMYEWLARFYRHEADPELLDSLRQADLPAQTDIADMASGYAVLRDFVAQPIDLTGLAAEYARVFLGVRRGATAFPYESVYTSPEHLIMQQARDEVLQAYRAEGIGRAPDFKEPEDHIALELEFMAYLCHQSEDTLASDPARAIEYARKQLDFLNRHLLRWTPTFCRDVENLARLDFYKGVARITSGFLQADAAIVEELVNELESDVKTGHA